MYAVYNYKPASTQAQVLSDIVAILSGTTNAGTLSASCNQTNTAITATVAAGWSVYDAAAGANTQCLRALNQDGTTYKYFTIAFNSTSQITVSGWESWNASTHVGTNQTSTTTFTPPWDAVNGGYLYIYATSKNFLLLSWTTAGYQACGGIMEFTRDTITPDTTFPCHALLSGAMGFTNGSGNANLSRTKNTTTTGVVSTLNVCIGPVNAQYQQSLNGYNNSHTYRDASDNLYVLTYPLGIAAYTGNIPLWVGSCYDVRSTGVAGFLNLDEIVFNGGTYVVFKGTSVYGVMVVPKA